MNSQSSLYYICSLKKIHTENWVENNTLQGTKNCSLFCLSNLTSQLWQSKYDFEAISHKCLGLSRTSGHTSMKRSESIPHF